MESTEFPKKVVVASTNPVKIEVAKRSFALVFPDETFEFIGVKSESGVPEQPTEEETRQGAINRLEHIKKHYPDAEFWMSQEGGIHHEKNRIFEQACIMVCDRTNFIAESLTAKFYLPKQVAKHIEDGMELSTAADMFFDDKNLRQGIGAIGKLTEGLIDRTSYYLQPAIIALSELKHKEWY